MPLVPRPPVPLPRRALLLLPAVLGALLGMLAGPACAAAAWGWPLPGTPAVLRPFAPGPTPWSAGHYGVDLAGSPGSAVRAPAAGTVTYAGQLAGRGVVVVDHGGGLRSTLEPVAPLVAVGERVVLGETVGLLAASGHACAGPCLHWGVRDGDAYRDPLSLLHRPVRLLPVVADGEPLAGGRSAPRTGPTSPSTSSASTDGPAPHDRAPLLLAPALLGGAAAWASRWRRRRRDG